MPGEGRVGSREIDELEQAEGAASRLRHGLDGVDAFLVDHDELAGRDLALVLGADEVESARLGCENRVAVDPPEIERPEAVGIAEPDELSLRQRDDRECALQPPHRAGDRLLERRRVVGDERGDHLGIGRRRQQDPLLEKLVAHVSDICEVAVVPEGDRPGLAVLDDRLGIRPVRRAGRRVARMADRDLSLEPAQVLLVEDLGDEAHVPQDGESPAIGHRDAGRLLPAVLKREEPEERDACDVAVRGANAEDAAHLFG